MTRKDYQAFAELFRAMQSTIAVNPQSVQRTFESVVNGACEIFSADNPRFDCDKFRIAIYRR